MTFCPEHPPKFTPLSETTSIPAAFIWEPPRFTCFHLSTISVISVKRLVVVILPTMKQQRLQSRLTNFNIVGWTKDRCHFVLQLRWGGLFMLKARVSSACCAKNMTRLILKISRRFHPQEFEDHYHTSQHMNAVSAEMLQRVSVFKRTLDERERVAEDVLLKVFTAAYWIMKEELPNNKIKSHVSPRAYMYSRLAATKKTLEPAFT